MMRDAVWLRHIRYNEEHYGFQQTLRDISHKDRKAVVLGTSPLYKRFGLTDLEKVMDGSLVTVACDIALPLLAELGKAPTYSVSVDSHPVVANFYRRSQKILPHVTPILSTTIHRDVVEECRKAGAEVHWIQGFSQKQSPLFHREGVSTLTSGGNVGTTSFVIASVWFECSPVGLLGLEFAWSDETPYFTLNHLKKLLRTTGVKSDIEMRGRFERFKNHRDGRTYVADYTYCHYLDWFREIWYKAPRRIKNNTYTLTREGILSARGLKQLTVSQFLNL